MDFQGLVPFIKRQAWQTADDFFLKLSLLQKHFAVSAFKNQGR